MTDLDRLLELRAIIYTNHDFNTKEKQQEYQSLYEKLSNQEQEIKQLATLKSKIQSILDDTILKDCDVIARIEKELESEKYTRQKLATLKSKIEELQLLDLLPKILIDKTNEIDTQYFLDLVKKKLLEQKS